MAHHPKGKSIIEPDGLRSKAAKLPSATTKRWVIRRKAQVVTAVREGVLSLEEARSRYMLTVDEFVAWERAIDEHGLAGLRTTRLQHYRTGRDQLHLPGSGRANACPNFQFLLTAAAAAAE